MKILWLPHAPWSVKQRARYLVEELVQRDDFDIHVISWTQLETAPDLLRPKLLASTIANTQALEQGVTVHHVPNVPLSMLSKPLRHLNASMLAKHVAHIVQHEKIDLVVAARPLALPRLGVPIIADFFDDNPSYWADHRDNKVMAGEIDARERRLAARADRRVCASHVLVEKVAGWGYTSTYVPNGFHVERVTGGDRLAFRATLGAEDTVAVIGFIGMFGEFSGLLRTMEGLSRWPRNAHLVVAGDGPQLPAARVIAARTGVSDRVTFLGWVPNARDFFAGIDAGLLPFDVTDFTSGACPIKLIEYTGAGKRTIATALEETLKMNLSGIVTCEATPAGIADGVSAFLRTRDVAANPDEVREFAWSVLAQNYAELIQGAMV
jgi:glycosyltransferase involved in cell wall biosynthesis